MSAIWGIVDFSEKTVGKSDIHSLSAYYDKYKIDKVQEITNKNYYMAAGIQFITREAQKEQFPYKHLDNTIMVADVIIDNRSEIVSEFGLTGELSRQGIDGSILYEAVEKDQWLALDRLCGAFVFARYDENENKLYLANDAVGNRSVYYSFNNGRFVFSSLLKSIVPFMSKVEVEEEWLSQFIENDNLIIVNNPALTPYKDIYRLEPGECLCINKKGIEHIYYWDPIKKVKPLKLKSDEEYKKRVLDTFKECVESVIRESGETGILLSGGLDSNAVAAFAAPYLKNKNRVLHSYTSVPNDKVDPIPKNSYYVNNERIYIEKLARYHENLRPHYINVAERDLLADNEKYLDMVETPIKTMVNAPWIYEAFKQAQADNCRILLGGQYGNITISFGFIRNLLITYKYSGRWISLLKSINRYGKKNNISRKKLLSSVLKDNKEGSLKYSRKYMYDKKALRQVGENELHESLLTGVLYRDPTRDRRLIELVLSLPIEQFVCPDIDRRLVRVYMKDIIPHDIVSDQNHRGAQGVAGYTYIREHWDVIKPYLKRKYNMSSAQKWLSKLDLCELIERIDIQNKTNDFELLKAIYFGFLCEYLENMKV